MINVLVVDDSAAVRQSAFMSSYGVPSRERNNRVFPEKRVSTVC